MKRQRTEWIWTYQTAKGTYIRVGWIHNKARGVAEDRVRVEIKTLCDHWDFNMRIDEALALVGGIGKTLCHQAIKDRVVLSPKH